MKIKYLLLPILFAGIAIFLNCRDHSPEKKAEWIVKKITSELDLNDSQKTDLKRIKDEILAKRKELKIGMEFIPMDMIDEIKKDKIDEEKTLKSFEEHAAKRKEFGLFMHKKFIEFHKVLTPDQRVKLHEKIIEFRNKHHH